MIDTMFALQMNESIRIFAKYCSLILIQHAKESSNINRRLIINDRWKITLLDKVDLHSNQGKHNEFTKKGYDNRINKEVALKNREIKSLRNILAKEIFYQDNFKDDRHLLNRDFQLYCHNPSMFLVMMSLLRKSNYVYVEMYPLIITNKDYYKLLDFSNPQIKNLKIICTNSNYYPVNQYKGDELVFNKQKENYTQEFGKSLAAHAIFSFLINSNFIYSLHELILFLY